MQQPKVVCEIQIININPREEVIYMAKCVGSTTSIGGFVKKGDSIKIYEHEILPTINGQKAEIL